MIPLALVSWVLGCLVVFYLALREAGAWLKGLEARTLEAAGRRLEDLWMGSEGARGILHATAAAGLLAGTLAGLALHPAAGALAAASMMGVPVLALRALAGRRRAAFERQLVDLLEGLAGSLQSGFSLDQGLRLAASQAPDPMRQELGLVLRQAELGAPLEEALEGLAARMPGEDLRLFVSAVSLARELGGGAAETLAQVAQSARRRRDVEGRVLALTAQGRLQGAVLALLPFGVGLALYAIQPGMMLRFLESPKGWALLALAAGLEILGILWIRRLLRLDY